MLYEILHWINQQFNIPGFGVFHYLTFRAILAAIFSLLISLFAGKKIISYLQRKLIGESIREVGPASHASKKGTPTMGGVIIIISIVVPTLLWGNMKSPYILLLLLGTVWMGAVGFLDDYIKVFKKNKAGLKGKFKIVGQVVLGFIVGITIVLHPAFEGLQPRIDEQAHIHPNLLLKKSGFQEQDKLLSIDGHAYQSLPIGENSPKVALYVVERKNKTIQVYIPTDERLRVSEMLFGTKQYGFVTSTNVPFYKDTVFNYSFFAFWEEGHNGWGTKLIYILAIIFIVTAVSNGVNITDGIDGLAAGTTAIVVATLAIFAYVSGNIMFSSYLNISFIPQAGEMFVFCAALLGACIGFLWYNAFPAQVFMGDTGSLALGGAVGVLAILVKKELLLPLICGIFFIESLSVIIQVAYFKYTKKKYGEGRRIFKMAPIHHHFELSGIHESKIVTRFMIITLLLEILAFATLKLR